jgi:hypothetical protein
VADSYVSSSTGVKEGEYTIKVDFVEVDPDHDFSDYLLRTQRTLRIEDGGHGYLNSGSGHHTRDLYYDGTKIFTADPSNLTTHCVGATYQIWVMAMNLYHDDTGADDVWNMATSLMSSWYPVKDCWYVNSGCEGANDVLETYGQGEKIDDADDLLPGDFLNINRTSGYGHSVMFLNYLYGDGTGGVQWSADVIGFRYVSSQTSTDGIGDRDAYFVGEGCPDSSQDDCNVYRDTYFYSGRVWHPAYYTTVTRAPFLLIDWDPDIVSEPTPPAHYWNN